MSSYLNGRFYFKATEIWSLLYIYIYIFKDVITNTKCYHQKQSLFQEIPIVKLARYKAKIHMFLFSIMNTFTKHKYFNIY